MGGESSKDCPQEKKCPSEKEKRCYSHVQPVVDVKDIEQSQDYNCWLNMPKGMMGHTFGSKKDCLNKCMNTQDCVGYLYPVDGKIPYTALRYNNTAQLSMDNIDRVEKNSKYAYNLPFKEARIPCGSDRISLFNMGDSKRINILQPGLDYKNTAIRLDKSLEPDLRGKNLKNVIIGGSTGDL